ncbi:hypothetical protein [Paludisphaera soli]|uniref:hypothetical protein n=1 Tax=Paludisphaera soli TaxID=2712865 RepID=UPI0013EDEDB6|nr:hypothetical protein [Paludisphaera soli]
MQIVEVGTHMAYSIPWFAWIALAAIACGTFSGVVKMLIMHRERMAMIRTGIDPDAPHRKPVFDDVDA